MQQSAGGLLRRVALPRLPGGQQATGSGAAIEGEAAHHNADVSARIIPSNGLCRRPQRTALLCLRPQVLPAAVFPALQHMVRDVLAPMFSNGIADLIDLR